MLEMCELLLSHAADTEQLSSDPVIQAAAQRWIEILGEAASNVSDELKRVHPEVGWRDIVGARVILAHAYFQIDPTIVKEIITRDIPVLRSQLSAIVEEWESND